MEKPKIFRKLVVRGDFTPVEMQTIVEWATYNKKESLYRLILGFPVSPVELLGEVRHLIEKTDTVAGILVSNEGLKYLEQRLVRIVRDVTTEVPTPPEMSCAEALSKALQIVGDSKNEEANDIAEWLAAILMWDSVQIIEEDPPRPLTEVIDEFMSGYWASGSKRSGE